MSFVLIFAVPLPPPFRRTKGIGAFFRRDQCLGRSN